MFQHLHVHSSNIVCTCIIKCICCHTFFSVVVDSLILNLFQSDVNLTTLLTMSFEDIKQSCMSCVHRWKCCGD